MLKRKSKKDPEEDERDTDDDRRDSEDRDIFPYLAGGDTLFPCYEEKRDQSTTKQYGPQTGREAHMVGYHPAWKHKGDADHENQLEAKDKNGTSPSYAHLHVYQRPSHHHPHLSRHIFPDLREEEYPHGTDEANPLANRAQQDERRNGQKGKTQGNEPNAKEERLYIII